MNSLADADGTNSFAEADGTNSFAEAEGTNSLAEARSVLTAPGWKGAASGLRVGTQPSVLAAEGTNSGAFSLKKCST